MHACKDCGIDVSRMHHHSRRCKKCQKKYRSKLCHKIEKTYGRAYKAFYAAKTLSKKKHRKFKITLIEYKNIVANPCVYCGETDLPRGIDRIDSRQGYVLGNCVSCCTKCNRMKSDMDLAAWLNQMNKIIKYFKLEG